MRLFTGLSLAPDALESLTRVSALLQPAAALRWSPPANLHITTRFIGAWPASRLTELQAALANVPLTGPIPVTIAGFGFFPNPHNPHSLFAAVQAAPELHTLARRIDEAVLALGGTEEAQPYVPHVTLAHVTPARDAENITGLQEQITSMTDTHFGSFNAVDFHLYLSEAGSYTTLATYSLLRAA